MTRLKPVHLHSRTLLVTVTSVTSRWLFLFNEPSKQVLLRTGWFASLNADDTSDHLHIHIYWQSGTLPHYTEKPSCWAGLCSQHLIHEWIKCLPPLCLDRRTQRPWSCEYGANLFWIFLPCHCVCVYVCLCSCVKYTAKNRRGLEKWQDDFPILQSWALRALKWICQAYVSTFKPFLISFAWIHKCTP